MKHRRNRIGIALTAGLLLGLAGLLPGVRDAGKDLGAHAVPALTYWAERSPAPAK